MIFKKKNIFFCVAFEKINYYEIKYHVDPHNSSLFAAYKLAEDGKWEDDSMLIQMLCKRNNDTKQNASKKKKNWRRKNGNYRIQFNFQFLFSLLPVPLFLKRDWNCGTLKSGSVMFFKLLFNGRQL